jgi:hypothetical protein
VIHGILQRWRAYDCTHCILLHYNEHTRFVCVFSVSFSDSKLVYIAFGFNCCEYPVQCHAVSKTNHSQSYILCRVCKEQVCTDRSAGMPLRGRCFILRYCKAIDRILLFLARDGRFRKTEVTALVLCKLNGKPAFIFSFPI